MKRLLWLVSSLAIVHASLLADSSRPEMMRLSSITNAIFLTEDGDGMLMSGFVSLESFQRDLQSPECRPAASDPEGHWGDVVEGFQVGIRITNTVCRIGEPIIATVIVRNVSEQRLDLTIFSGLQDDFIFAAISPTKERLQEKREPRYPLGSKGVQFPKGTQRKFSINLTERFDLLSPGTYVFSAETGVYPLDINVKPKRMRISSAPVVVHINAEGQTPSPNRTNLPSSKP